MPIYASLQDMQDRHQARDLIQLTDGDGAPDAARIDRALDKADATITGYVARRYKNAPDKAGHALLTEIACDIAFYEIHRSDPPDKVMAQHRHAMKQLADIASGLIKLDDGSPDQPPRPDAIITGGPAKKFSRDNLRHY